MINACKQYKSTIRKHYTKHITDLKNKIRRLRTENPKDYWKMINGMNKKTDTTPIPLIDMFQYFRTLNSCATTQSDENLNAQDVLLNLAHLENNETFQLSQASLDNPISESEINAAIKSLKTNKSSGTDGILNEYITATKHIFIPIYKKNYSTSYLKMVPFQVTGLKATSSLYTKTKVLKSDPANYRPITCTLLSCVGKLFTSILYNRLSTFLEGNSILNETQSGFRKDYSTIDNIFSLYSLTEYFKSKKSKLYCCFVDFTKAFDSVWRDGLWQKVLKHGIQGKTFDII